MKLKLALIALYIVLTLSATLDASAISVVGGIFKADVVPGEQIKHKITVSIDKDEEPTEAIAGVFGYGLNPDGGRGPLAAEEDKNPYSAREFLNITPENAILNPGEPVTFILEGKIPDNVGSGGRYAFVYIATPPRGSGQVGIALASIIPVILTLSGSDFIETGKITNLTVSKGNISAIFLNTGNYHYKASAVAVLKDDKGNVIANATAPLAFTSIIPTASWLFNMSFKRESDLAAGVYYANVSVFREDGTVLDNAEAEFKF